MLDDTLTEDWSIDFIKVLYTNRFVYLANFGKYAKLGSDICCYTKSATYLHIETSNCGGRFSTEVKRSSATGAAHTRT